MIGFIGGLAIYYIVTMVLPLRRAGIMDEGDVFGTFTDEVAQQKGIIPASQLLTQETRHPEFGNTTRADASMVG